MFCQCFERDGIDIGIVAYRVTRQIDELMIDLIGIIYIITF